MFSFLLNLVIKNFDNIKTSFDEMVKFFISADQPDQLAETLCLSLLPFADDKQHWQIKNERLSKNNYKPGI